MSPNSLQKSISLRLQKISNTARVRYLTRNGPLPLLTYAIRLRPIASYKTGESRIQLLCVPFGHPRVIVLEGFSEF